MIPLGMVSHISLGYSFWKNRYLSVEDDLACCLGFVEKMSYFGIYGLRMEFIEERRTEY